MEIIETISGFKQLKRFDNPPVLTIGNFDGVHIGHRKILAHAHNLAHQRNTELVAMTFEPHPVAILHPEKAPGVLTPLPLKKHLLAQCGVDCLIVLKDSAELLALSPQDFVTRFLMQTVKPAVVVEGEDFNFGARRAGSIRTLYNLGIEKGFEVIVVEPKEAKLSIGQSVNISSTLIRNMLEAGKVADAATALSTPYRLIGQVTTGQGKGKKLGFPTANLKPTKQIIPAQGVYVGRVAIANSKQEVCSGQDNLPSALSIGTASTIASGNQLLIEAHILADNVENLEDKWMALDFVKKIRDQQKFKTEAELSAQIAKDCQHVKEILERGLLK